MGYFAYTVETFDGARHSRLGDFRTLKAARAAARIACQLDRITTAVVKDAAGLLVYALEGDREWERDTTDA